MAVHPKFLGRFRKFVRINGKEPDLWRIMTGHAFHHSMHKGSSSGPIRCEYDNPGKFLLYMLIQLRACDFVVDKILRQNPGFS